ncbi:MULTISPECIES: c-type cytochrome [Pseudomonas]|jgi:cytochrome c5|uniref:Cytochrome c5 family protein n=1 Tax=Pseudomonas mosselii TaxID=78327 RepID=A0A5R8ZI84_9PSED|nr:MULTISPECIES: c-type cytochrome [Pseudomonas]MBH3459240.1 cytochrome c5 family protein [Pseudomonas putida]MDW2779233.1 c-type cytochrome [Pseudomonas sp. BEA3.1]TLP65134.1 cytochrome c5 family protein [Pseudomonas mosselii]
MKRTLLITLTAFMIATAQAAQEPEAVFSKTCAMCHNGQLPNAPKKGDIAAWKPRLAQGQEILLKNVVNGLSVMPPRGLCSDCSDEDLLATIGWMSR